MAQEIERKFLVKEGFKEEAYSSTPVTQGYLSSVPERIVRIRIYGIKGFITIKGVSNISGISRYEWEKEIPVSEAAELLKICEPGLITKTRFLVKSGESTFEVDEFHGDNLGLVVAEIELLSEDAVFNKPAWLGEEVTGDRRYYNSMLAVNPFSRWR